MTIIETMLVIIAIAALGMAVATIVAVVRLDRLMTRKIEPLVEDMHATVKRAQIITGDVEHVVQNARRLEQLVNLVLEGSLTRGWALARGIGAGVMALVKPRPGRIHTNSQNDAARPDGEGSQDGSTLKKGGDEHE